jgi:hypothetical protein
MQHSTVEQKIYLTTMIYDSNVLHLATKVYLTQPRYTCGCFFKIYIYAEDSGPKKYELTFASRYIFLKGFVADSIIEGFGMNNNLHGKPDATHVPDLNTEFVSVLQVVMLQMLRKKPVTKCARSLLCLMLEWFSMILMPNKSITTTHINWFWHTHWQYQIQHGM